MMLRSLYLFYLFVHLAFPIIVIVVMVYSIPINTALRTLGWIDSDFRRMHQ